MLEVERKGIKSRNGQKKNQSKVKMSVRWETEGLQTVGIVCLVIMFLKLMHLLGLIDITETGETTRDGTMRKRRRADMLKRSL